MKQFEPSQSVLKPNPSLSASGERLKKPRMFTDQTHDQLIPGILESWEEDFDLMETEQVASPSVVDVRTTCLRMTMPPQKTDTRMSEDVVTMVYMTEYRLLIAHVTDVQAGRRFMQSLIISFPQRWRNSHSTNICRCRTFGKWCRRQMAISPTWLLPNKDTDAW